MFGCVFEWGDPHSRLRGFWTMMDPQDLRLLGFYCTADRREYARRGQQTTSHCQPLAKYCIQYCRAYTAYTLELQERGVRSTPPFLFTTLRETTQQKLRTLGPLDLIESSSSSNAPVQCGPFRTVISCRWPLVAASITGPRIDPPAVFTKTCPTTLN